MLSKHLEERTSTPIALATEKTSSSSSSESDTSETVMPIQDGSHDTSVAQGSQVATVPKPKRGSRNSKQRRRQLAAHVSETPIPLPPGPNLN